MSQDIRATASSQAAGRDIDLSSDNATVITANTSHGGIAAAGQTVHVNVGTLRRVEPLSREQRSHLNNLIRELAEASGLPAGYHWKSVHRDFNVSSVEEMTTEHYLEAKKMLESYLREVRQVKPQSTIPPTSTVSCTSCSQFQAKNAEFKASMKKAAESLTLMTTKNSQLNADISGLKAKLASTNSELADLNRQVPQIKRESEKWRASAAQNARSATRRGQWIGFLLIVVTGTAALAGYTHLSQSSDAGCFHEGKEFSAGGFFSDDSNVYRCAISDNGPPQWISDPKPEVRSSKKTSRRNNK